MKRVQLFEFEDFSWFPSVLRDSMTKVIVVLQKMMGIPPVLGKLIRETLEETGETEVIDLGSGAGGVMPMVHESLTAEGRTISITMSDKHPNPRTISEVNSKNDSTLRYLSESVDAMNLSNAPKGLKTMVNSFHHMPKENAKAILKSAQESGQPILIYEMAENNIPTVLWWLLLPLSLVITTLMCLFLTPFVRGLTWQQIVFTYIVPIIPLAYAWDGQASLPRMYTFSDIDELMADFPKSSYVWKKGRAIDSKGKKRGTYLIGMPN